MTEARCAKILDDLFGSLSLKARAKACRREGAFMICDVALRPGGTVAKIEKHGMEIALALRAKTEPLIYPVTSEGVVRLEAMLDEPGIVKFSDIVSSPEFGNGGCAIPLALGRTRRGKPFVADLAKMPHLLLAGATGSGKSMLLQAVIQSILRHPGTRPMLALVDPKQVEFSRYDGSSALWAATVRNPEEAEGLLAKLISEMESRFAALRKAKVRDISQHGSMRPIVLVIDELADLMMASKKSVQDLICRLAQKSRACGIHLVVATQRPSIDVVTGIIKANFPARLSCHVSSATDSRVILDRCGAEKLLGAGDAILDAPGYSFIRFRGALLSDEDMGFRAPPGGSWWGRLWRAGE